VNLDDEDIDALVAIGRKVNGRTPAPKKEDEPEVKLLQKILKAIEFQATRPAPEMPKMPEPKAPVVNVPAPVVTVNPAQPITEWKFTLTKDKQGRTTEIIAKAII